MRVIRYGSPDWRRFKAALPRAASPGAGVRRTVAGILGAVRRDGDAALVRLTARFDRVRLRPAEIHVPERVIRAAARRADRAVVAALGAMAERIVAYHEKQLERGFRIRLGSGSWAEEIVRPIDSVGLYVPGGAGAYPSSVLMNAIPALVAGVPVIAVVTPPRALDANPAIAAALEIVGLSDSVYRVGGAQAVAALAYGTRVVPKVAKIVGPGNAYVAEAKRQVRGAVEIDQDAGPSEVVILADETADAGWVAVDLLAQAEHGSGQETAVLVTPARALGEEVARLVAAGVGAASNAARARKALARHGAVVIVGDLDEGVQAVNALAPEHLEIVTRRAASVARTVVAGAVFIGPFTPVAAGDYGTGPNHVLPTGGASRYSSPLSVRDFVRRQSALCLTERGLGAVAADIARVALAEGFRAHAESVLTRFES